MTRRRKIRARLFGVAVGVLVAVTWSARAQVETDHPTAADDRAGVQINISEHNRAAEPPTAAAINAFSKLDFSHAIIAAFMLVTFIFIQASGMMFGRRHKRSADNDKKSSIEDVVEKLNKHLLDCSKSGGEVKKEIAVLQTKMDAIGRRLDEFIMSKPTRRRKT